MKLTACDRDAGEMCSQDAAHSLCRPRLSVIIPAFNESARILPTLERTTDYLRQQSWRWEIIVVDDGSSDGTGEVVTEWARGMENARLISRPHFGKGWAVRAGMLEAAGEYCFMCDADLAMPIEWLGRFVERMDAGEDIVIGSREAPGARRFDEPWYRHFMGRAFNRAVRLIAVRGLDDTQCGFKCFRANAAAELFRLQRSKGMGFDVEILYLARKRGYEIEVLPIDWYHDITSKVRPVVDTLDMLKDAVLIRLRDISGMYR